MLENEATKTEGKKEGDKVRRARETDRKQN